MIGPTLPTVTDCQRAWHEARMAYLKADGPPFTPMLGLTVLQQERRNLRPVEPSRWDFEPAAWRRLCARLQIDHIVERMVEPGRWEKDGEVPPQLFGLPVRIVAPGALGPVDGPCGWRLV